MSEATFGARDNTGKSLGKLELRMFASRSGLTTITDSVSEKLADLRIPEEKQYEILLAVQEALANAIIHGCKDDPLKEVRCEMEWYADGRVLMVVADPGDGFAPDDVAHPVHPDNLHADHGRGVYLIRQLMDEVSFHGRGNEIRMWKY